MKIDFVRMIPSFFTLPLRVRYLPRHMQMDVTTSCNLQCRMCYAKKAVDEAQKHRHLSFDDFKTMFDAARPESVNLAASGEPFMNPGLCEMIRYAGEHGAQTIISTNFIIPDEAKIRAVLDAGLDILKISIDGATPAVYEQIRGPYFGRLLTNLAILEKVRAERQNTGASVRIDYVLLRPNVDDIGNIVDFAHAHGIRHIFYRICDPRGWDAAQRGELLDGAYATVVEGMKSALLKAKKLRITTNLAELLRHKDTWRFIYEDAKAVPAARRPVCLLPWMQLFTSISGEMSCCCSIYPAAPHSLGNVLQGDGWNNDRWQKMRHLFRTRRNYGIFEGCSYCIPMSREYLLNLVRMFPGYIKRLLRAEKK